MREIRELFSFDFMGESGKANEDSNNGDERGDQMQN